MRRLYRVVNTGNVGNWVAAASRNQAIMAAVKAGWVHKPGNARCRDVTNENDVELMALLGKHDRPTWVSRYGDVQTMESILQDAADGKPSPPPQFHWQEKEIT